MGDEVARTDADDLWIAPPFDPVQDITQKAAGLMMLSEDAARRSMARDERDNPDVPFPWTPNAALLAGDGVYVADPVVARDQEERRRAYGILVDLEIAAHRAQAEWAVENEGVAWLDENGEAMTLEAVIEQMMPDDAGRAFSGRAKQRAKFPKAAKAMQDAGVPLETIVKVADTGKASVFSIVASAQAKLAKTVPDPVELKEKYEELIELAATEQPLDDLEEKAAQLWNSTIPDRPRISYSVEQGDGDVTWVVMRIEEQGLMRLFFKRLKDVLELATSTLFETVTKRWRSG